MLYSLQLALKSIRGTPAISVVTVLAIAIGIGVSTTMIAVFHVFSQNPIPHKSDHLFNVRVESWGLDSEFFGIKPGDPPKQITYRDMTGLRQSDIPKYRTGIASAAVYVFPEDKLNQPYQTIITLCHADFFSMFEVPLHHGSGWNPESDRRRDPVVVLSHEANERLFGGLDSVGKKVKLNTGTFTVSGVMAPWKPTPRFYNVINNSMGRPNEFFLPFDLIRDQGLSFKRVGDADSWGNFMAGDNPDSFFTASETCWIQYWVELDPAKVGAYRGFLDRYSEEQKALGRFPRPLNNRVTPLMEWMKVREVTPPAIVMVMMISLLFLLVCALNLMGLLLGKFLARSNLVGVHRALGATRGAIFGQHILECKLVGVIGGVVGLGFAVFALRVINGMIPSGIIPSDLLRIDATVFGWAILLSLLASLVAGVYPAWRACNIAPAVQIKLQ